MTDDDTTPAGREQEAANLFDLRRIIGGLFVVLGLLLTILGAFDSQEEIDRAAGVNINLWAGLGMLVVGALFLIWAFARPLSEQFDSQQSGGWSGGDGEGAGGSGGPGPQ
jgi:drug/metabolite transporter (DMT)-like permease